MDEFNIWDYYKQVISTSDMRKAECRLCYNVISYTSTIHNLKSHLAKKHAEEIPGMVSQSQATTTNTPHEKVPDRRTGVEKSFIWEYFTKIKDQEGMSSCNICHHVISFKTTISNLKRHLLRKHVKEIEIAEEDDLEETADSPKSIHTDPDARNLIYSESEDPTWEEPTTKKSTRLSSSKLWNYFLRDTTDRKEAKCFTCGTLISYRSTTHNLKHHLQRKHKDKYQEICRSLDSDIDDITDHANMTPKVGSLIWKFFEKTNTDAKLAKCITCGTNLSYKSTMSNLKKHLQNKHPGAYDEEYHSMMNRNPLDGTSVASEDTHDNDSNQSETEMEVDMDKFFTLDRSATNARCDICQANVEVKRNGLINHLKREHSKILKPVGDETDAEEQEDLFQEVVYLYDSDSKGTTVRHIKQDTSTPNTSQRQKEKHKVRQYTPSISLDNRKRRRIEEKVTNPPIDQSNQPSEELENFGKYVTCLLKTVPEDLCTQLQMEIINLIMTAKIKIKSKCDASTSPSVNQDSGLAETFNQPIVVTINTTSMPSPESNMEEINKGET